MTGDKCHSRAIAKTNKYFSKNYFLFFGQEFRDGWAQNAFISIYRNTDWQSCPNWVGAGDHVDAWPEKVKHFSIVLSKIWLDRL